MKSITFTCVLLLLLHLYSCTASTIVVTRNQTLSSPGGHFELGFFSPAKNNHYLGIWYKKLSDHTVIWVANRNQPISNISSSSLNLLQNGNLVLLNQSHSQAVIWSTHSSWNTNSTAVRLLDNGNLVLTDAFDSTTMVWQSFDYPTNHWMPGGKIGQSTSLSLFAWRSAQNPAPALFSAAVERNGTSHLLLWNRSQVYWTSGEWTGESFAQVPEIRLNFYVKNLTYISNEMNQSQSYFTYESAVPGAYTRFLLDSTGQLRQYVWRESYNRWVLFWTRPPEECDVYALCGPFGICNQTNTPRCSCMEGFEPKVKTDWELEDYSDGCVRSSPLQCDVNGGNTTFRVMSNVQTPANPMSVNSSAKVIEECERECLRNCECNAFAYDDNDGCLIWTRDVYNLQQYAADERAGKDFHIRIAGSSSTESSRSENKRKGNNDIWIIVSSVAGAVFIFACVVILLWRVIIKRKKDYDPVLEDTLVLFKYKELKGATKNFSEKLGEGAFGYVYKGTLPNSATLIAVKKLKNLYQGEKQFRAEVKTIGSIQHINLVRLRGICIHTSQRLLVYDYMPNGSLESTLFRKTAKVLDWKTRFQIALGTARGLAYLHEKCRECIIHCDIKPENILLDQNYKPKVADFGLAKLIGREFSRVLTTMRGTRGYLAPEWISGEAITTKADVFSYGMLVFELISGRRNSEVRDDEGETYFPFTVANAIAEGREDVVELLDERLGGDTNVEELSRACRVACWCIQDNENDRPSMGLVVQLLEGLTQVGTPPMPHFLRGFSENPTAGALTIFEETSSTSASSSLS